LRHAAGVEQHEPLDAERATAQHFEQHRGADAVRDHAEVRVMALPH
jgi:hypothetical protein